MFSKFQRTLLRKPSVQQVRNLAVSFDGYGQHLFKGAVAAPYLEKVGLPVNTLETNTWTTNGQADKVRQEIARRNQEEMTVEERHDDPAYHCNYYIIITRIIVNVPPIFVLPR